MRLETVRIHFLSDVFGLLSSRNFATMATWRDDFSSLLYDQNANSSYNFRIYKTSLVAQEDEEMSNWRAYPKLDIIKRQDTISNTAGSETSFKTWFYDHLQLS